MLRLICAAALLALANCDSENLNIFEGQWTVVKVYPDIPLKAGCEPITIELSSDQCNLGKKKIPVFKITNRVGEIIKVPVVPMDTEENDIEEAFAPKCVCKNEKVDTDMLFAFRYLSDNYFLVYTSYAGPGMVLVAKDVPTEEELKEYEGNSTVLSNKEGSILCTKDKDTNNRKASNKFAANKNTATITHWMNYRPTKTTTEPATN